METREKLAMLEDMLELDKGALTEDMPLTDVEGYDSMAKLSLIVLMGDEFNVQLSGEQIRAFQTVGDIVSLMNRASE